MNVSSLGSVGSSVSFTQPESLWLAVHSVNRGKGGNSYERSSYLLCFLCC